jgi:uncharacterized protein (TIGR03435 family)
MGKPLQVSSPLIRLEGYTLFGLLLDAYGVRDYQVSMEKGVSPEDVLDTLYDVRAKAPGESAPAVSEVRAMLRSLLIERFQLEVRRETKEMPVYWLTAKQPLPRSTKSGECVVTERAASSDGRNREIKFTSCPIERVTHRLQLLLDDHRPVIDGTGLEGVFDFSLTATPEYIRRGSSGNADISPISAVVDLGMKLETRRAAVEVLVVERVQKLEEN